MELLVVVAVGVFLLVWVIRRSRDADKGSGGGSSRGGTAHFDNADAAGGDGGGGDGN